MRSCRECVLRVHSRAKAFLVKIRVDKHSVLETENSGRYLWQTSDSNHTKSQVRPVHDENKLKFQLETNKIKAKSGTSP